MGRPDKTGASNIPIIHKIGMSKTIRELLGGSCEFRARRFTDEAVLSESVEKLNLNPENMIHSIDSLARDVFVDGVNWGRIIYFFCLLRKLIERHQPDKGLVSEVVSLTRTLKETLLDGWIGRNGGEKTFDALFKTYPPLHKMGKEIYCVKERKRTSSVPGSERYERARNGRLMLKAKCANCGITKNRFVSETESSRNLN